MVKTLMATPDPEPKRKPMSLTYALANGGVRWAQFTNTTVVQSWSGTCATATIWRTP